MTSSAAGVGRECNSVDGYRSECLECQQCDFEPNVGSNREPMKTLTGCFPPEVQTAAWNPMVGPSPK